MSKDFWEKSASFFSKRKIPFLIQKCGFIHVKMCIYIETLVYSHGINLVLSCLYASLSHQRFYCKIQTLFLSNKSMSQDKPPFRYICNFLPSFSLQITTHIWNLLLQSQLCFSWRRLKLEDIKKKPWCHPYLLFIYSSCLEQEAKNSQIPPSKNLFQIRNQHSSCQIISLYLSKQQKMCRLLLSS